MEWIERLNKAINYIEEHLTGDIDYDRLGRLPAVPPIIFSGCSDIWRECRCRNIFAAAK